MWGSREWSLCGAGRYLCGAESDLYVGQQVISMCGSEWSLCGAVESDLYVGQAESDLYVVGQAGTYMSDREVRCSLVYSDSRSGWVLAHMSLHVDMVHAGADTEVHRTRSRDVVPWSWRRAVPPSPRQHSTALTTPIIIAVLSTVGDRSSTVKRCCQVLSTPGKGVARVFDWGGGFLCTMQL